MQNRIKIINTYTYKSNFHTRILITTSYINTHSHSIWSHYRSWTHFHMKIKQIYISTNCELWFWTSHIQIHIRVYRWGYRVGAASLSVLDSHINDPFLVYRSRSRLRCEVVVGTLPTQDVCHFEETAFFRRSFVCYLNFLR